MPRNRPAPDFVTGPVTRALRLVATLGIAALTVYILVRFPSLPEIVPIHFNFSGEADGFGARSSLLWLAAIMLAIGALVAWLSTKPQVFNYPTEITEANAQRMYREGERMMVWVLAGVAVVYLGIVLQTFADGDAVEAGIAASGAGSGVGQAVLVAGLIVLLGSAIAGLVRMVIADNPK